MKFTSKKNENNSFFISSSLILYLSCVLLVSLAITPFIRAQDASSIPSLDQFEGNDKGQQQGGLRLIETVHDLATYVLEERRPTILMLWSSNQKDCEAPFDCALMEADFQTAAKATKDYVRFAELDVSTTMGKEIVKTTMGEEALKVLPKFLLFEKPAPQDTREKRDVGRKASPVTIGLLESYIPAYKELASRLLPTGGANVVENVATSIDFSVKSTEAQRATVLYLTPKGKPTLAGRSLEIMLEGFGNMAYVYPETIPKKTLDSLSAKWNVPVKDILTRHSKIIVLSAQEGVSHVMPNTEDKEPSLDDMFQFVLLSLQNEMKRLATPVRVHRLSSDVGLNEFQRQILFPDPPTVLAFRHKDNVEEEVPPVELEYKENGLAWGEVASTMESFGGQALMIYCTETSPVCEAHAPKTFTSGWTFIAFHHRRSDSQSDTIKEQESFDKASDAMQSVMDKISSRALEVVHEIDGVHGKNSKTFEKCLEKWELDGEHGKLPLIFVDDNLRTVPPPVWVISLAESLNSIAQVFRVTNATATDIGEILVDRNENGTYTTPALFSFLPDKQIEGHLRSIVYESQTMGKLGFNTGLIFGFNLFRIINEKRSDTWLNSVRSVLPTSTRTLRTILSKESSVKDIATRNVTRVTDANTLRAACGTSPICIIGILTEDDDAEDSSKNLQIFRTARSQYYAAGGTASVPWVFLKGPCVVDPKFLDTLGLDNSALPVVTAYTTLTNAGPFGGFTTMKGSFESQHIGRFARDATTNRVKFYPLTEAKLESYLLQPEKCPLKPEEETPLDPDILNEMKSDEEREAALKAEVMRVAKIEAAKLIQEREAEAAAKQNELNRRAEEEASKKKRQEEL